MKIFHIEILEVMNSFLNIIYILVKNVSVYLFFL